MTDQETLDQAIDAAIEGGYRHFDCAELYENETMVGLALKKACDKYKITREQLWITSKIPPYMMDYESAKECISNSAETLNQMLEPGSSGYLDLVLIHWPTTIVSEPGLDNRLSVWKALSEMQGQGLVKTIGVSNFTVKHLKEFLANGIRPTVNQIETHPLYQDEETIKLCQQENITLISYAPLATYDERLMKSPTVLSLCEKYGKQANQIALRWAIERGFVVIPKSSKREHIHNNIALSDFSLTKEEVEAVSNLNIMFKTDWDPKDEI